MISDENPISKWLMKEKEIPIKIKFNHYPNGIEIRMFFDPVYIDGMGQHGGQVIVNAVEYYSVSTIHKSDLNDAYIAERLDKMYKDMWQRIEL